MYIKTYISKHSRRRGRRPSEGEGWVREAPLTSETLPATEARQEFFALLDQVAKANRGFTFTKGGRPIARLLNYEEWQGLLATLEILANPRHRKQLDRRIAEIYSGKNLSLKELLD